MFVLLVFCLGALAQRDLVRVRQVNLNHSANMRNLVADETVKIGDASYLLPVSAGFWWSYLSAKPRRTVITYKNYRHFEESTKISVQ